MLLEDCILRRLLPQHANEFNSKARLLIVFAFCWQCIARSGKIT
jgi:hypothetical protein